VRVAGLAAAAVLVLVLAGLSFAWAGRSGRALEPAPANPTTHTTSVTPPSELQQWVDALPAGAPPATPYWHDGILHVRGEQIAAPNGVGQIHAAGDTVLVVGASGWELVRGDRLDPLGVSASDVALSVDGRIAYWMDRQENGTTRFSTWDTKTKTALASRTVPGTSVEMLGIDADGSAYWQDSPLDPVTRWDVRADTIHPTGLVWNPGSLPPELFDGIVPWMHPDYAYRSPDGTKTLMTDSVPRENPAVGIFGDLRLRVRPAGPDDSVDPKDVKTLSISQEFPSTEFVLGSGNGNWVWWESNDSVLIAVDGDLRTYLVRCSATGGPCQRVADLGPLATQTPNWEGDWEFARAPVSP
jgi:hypothetical protein